MRYLLLLALYLCPAAQSFAQSASPDAATRQQLTRDFMTPGPMHRVLGILAGTWDGDVTFWPAPGAPAIKSTSHAVNTTLYDGLYQEQEHTGSIMGRAYLSKLVWGYDNARKKFCIFGIDNMGSGFFHTEGDYDSTTRTFTFLGTKTDPVTGRDNILKETRKLVDDNTQIMDMYVPDAATGKDFHLLQIIYKRKAS